MKYKYLNEVSDKCILAKVNYQDLFCLITKPLEKSLPNSNLFIFDKVSKRLVNNPLPPVEADDTHDSFSNFWLKENKLFVGTWSGFQFEIDKETGQLKNLCFTK